MANSWRDSGPPSPISDTEDVAPGPELLPELRGFASWAFGPHGIPSLQMIALGDYAHGGRATWNNFLLCRCTEEGKRFRYIANHEPAAKEILEEYRDMLEACPIEPLLGREDYT